MACLLLAVSLSAQQPNATLWFFRPANSRDADSIPTVYRVGTLVTPLATLRPGEFFGLRVAPGRYLFSYTRVPARNEGVTVQIEANDETFIEVHYRELINRGKQSNAALLFQLKPIPLSSTFDTDLIRTLITAAPSITFPSAVSTSTRPPSSLRNPASGPRGGLMLGVGFSRPGKLDAAGVAIGGSFRWNRFLSFAAVDVSHRSTPYEFDTFSNGQTRCRDKSNGEFALDILCEEGRPITVTAGMLDANVLLLPIMLGGGYRVGNSNGAYASVGFANRLPDRKNLWFVRSNFGKDILQVHAGIAFHWP